VVKFCFWSTPPVAAGIPRNTNNYNNSTNSIRLEILAFPSKDFGGQELETNEAIATFCYTRYSVDFPLFAKTKIRGENKHPLYRYLTEKSPFTGEVRWNFEKYLVDRKGSVIARYYSSVLPLSEEIISDLERTLAFQS
jgi:glutathione peroxidase